MLAHEPKRIHTLSKEGRPSRLTPFSYCVVSVFFWLPTHEKGYTTDAPIVVEEDATRNTAVL